MCVCVSVSLSVHLLFVVGENVFVCVCVCTCTHSHICTSTCMYNCEGPLKGEKEVEIIWDSNPALYYIYVYIYCVFTLSHVFEFVTVESVSDS